MDKQRFGEIFGEEELRQAEIREERIKADDRLLEAARVHWVSDRNDDPAYSEAATEAMYCDLGATDLAFADKEDLAAAVEQITEEMKMLVGRLEEIVSNPLLGGDGSNGDGFWMAYLVEQIGENIQKRNPYNTDLSDLAKAIEELEETAEEE